MSSSSSFVMDGYYSLTQQKTMALVPKFSAALSLPSSLFIIYEASRDQRHGKGTPIHRALIGMSCIDCLSSLGYFLGHWLVPEGFVWGSVGNQYTCNLQGFAVVAACGPPMFNTTIVIFCLLMIKYRWPDARIALYEKWIYLGIVAWAIGLPFAMMFRQLYKPVGVICWPAEEWGCYGDVHAETGEECPNSNPYAWIYAVVIFYLPIYASFVIISVCLAMIYWEVRQTHRRLLRYSSTRYSSNTCSQPGGDTDEGATTTNHLQLQPPATAATSTWHVQGRSGKDVQQIGTKAILYSAAFFAIFVPSTVWSVYGYTGVSPFGIIVASLFCEPLQGFWNLLIFARDRPATRQRIWRILTLGYGCQANRNGLKHEEASSGGASIQVPVKQEQGGQGTSTSMNAAGDDLPCECIGLEEGAVGGSQIDEDEQDTRTPEVDGPSNSIKDLATESFAVE